MLRRCIAVDCFTLNTPPKEPMVHRTQTPKNKMEIRSLATGPTTKQ